MTRTSLIAVTLIAGLLAGVDHARAVPVPTVVSNPIAMTLTQALAMPSLNRAEEGRINLLPKRPETFLLEERHDLRFRYLLQENKTAPIVFVLPGTGGTASAPGALYIAEKLYGQGYTAITVDNSFSWPFVVAGSTSTLPGYLPHDSQDMYKALQKIRAKIVRENQLKPASYAMVGYSLGALESVFIKKIDDTVKTFKFSKVLLINTPVDLVYALTKIDALYARGSQLSRAQKDYIYGRVITVGEKYLNKGGAINFADPEFLNRAFDEFKFNDEDMIFLIGDSFRGSVRDVIFASQQIKDRGLLKEKATRYHRSARYAEAASYSYMQYVNQFLLPSLKGQMGTGTTVQDLNDRTSLYQFASYLRSQPGIYAAHSDDDFILKPSDVGWLKQQFGSRLMMFQYGGHCGSINFPEFAHYVQKVFPKI